MSFACGSNSGQSELYCAFTLAQPVDHVIAVEVVVDVQHSASTLPNWWQLGALGQDCRPNNLSATADFVGHSACADMWAGATSRVDMLNSYTPTEPRGEASQARIKASVSVLPGEAQTLNATSTYYAVRIILKNGNTTGSPACAGCDQPACIVLNSILVGRLPGQGPDVTVQTAGTGNANWATWQGGAGANCAAVPVRTRAWGQVKSLYR